MWDYESYRVKAQLYFGRACDHPKAEDDEFGIWALLGLEFLLRAPLAKVHPSLLASPDGDSLLAANGIPTSQEPTTLPMKAVLQRLVSVVEGFDKEEQRDATYLMNVRNSELHSGASAVANAKLSDWLPRFIRVVRVLCSHLDLLPEQMLSEEVVAQADKLVGEEDAKVMHEASRKRNAAKAFFEKLRPSEVASRRAAAAARPPFGGETEPCPACGSPAFLALVYVRTTAEAIEDEDIVQDQVYVAESLDCVVCELHLESTAEVAALGIAQMRTVERRETFHDRFAEYVGWDEYGND